MFIRHQTSENSPFTTQNSPTNVLQLMTIFYSDVAPLSKYSPVTLYLSPVTGFLNKNCADFNHHSHENSYRYKSKTPKGTWLPPQQASFNNTIILFIVPHAFGILIMSIPQCLRISSSTNPLLPLEFRKATCDMVWIFWNCPLFQASQFGKFHAQEESQPGLSIRASRWPKPLASQPSLACYFHLLLP